MALLTRENLDQNYFRYGDYGAYERGKAYFQAGRAEVIAFEGSRALCRVTGSRADYEVVITALAKDRIHCTCDCPQAERVRVCKHMVAAVLAVRDYIRLIAEKEWNYKLEVALEKNPSKPKAPEAENESTLAFFGLEKIAANGQDNLYRLFPYKVSSLDWAFTNEIEQIKEPEDWSTLLDNNRAWARFASTTGKPMQTNRVLNLTPEGVQLYNIVLQNASSYLYSGITDVFSYLPLIEKLNIPIFRLKKQQFGDRLHVQTTPLTLEAALTVDEQHYTLQAGVRIDEQIFSLSKRNLHVIQIAPSPWLLVGTTLAPVANVEALDLLRIFPLIIPIQEKDRFRDHFFPVIASRMPISGEMVQWIDIDEDPKPRLYLSQEDGQLKAALRYGYGDYEVEPQTKPPTTTLINIPESWGAVRIQRKPAKEAHVIQLLTDAVYGLKRAGEIGLYEIRARTHPYDFLTRCIPALTQQGFEIFGQENLGRVNPHKPTIRLNISSGIDWFDLNAAVQYGDQEVPLTEIRRVIKRGERFVKLADGSIGQIPPEWLERYKTLFNMAEDTGESLRIQQVQLSLVDELLAEAEQKDIAEEFNQQTARLKNFSNIEPASLAAGFQGELRPYQKAGLDWLNFLHEYRLGGVLADDMGLGKTVQVLALLQRLKEQGESPRAALLVAPKSLLANWQRESARFTPDLRIVEYSGVGRRKDPEQFANCDILITTYGILLRDIDILHKYRFHYAILDESQAIKNPLAQSSKAARLVQADHRLVLTGTPVENNTFELWSQFAFVNPGLLGNLEMFKREFASSIERKEDNNSIQTLRRLIHPFLLRRTKKQVAPELPPRTERLIYTDLEPAQRKLYITTRDHYRDQLMGLIDEGGMNNARMKILEGLLRLRQICIHPALVEPTYQGPVAKFEMVLETLETLKEEGHKALIFSQFVQTLNLLRAEMELRNLPYTYLDGRTRDRQEQVDLFQNQPDIPFFLISLKAGGVGLNLTAADYVLHLDPWWNPAVEAQASDRAHRIGQEKPVFIYKYIVRDSVEEKILDLQEHKKDLVEQLITAESGFFKSITRDDVKNLFS